MKIIIPGGKGYIGRFVSRFYLLRGWQVTVLTRLPSVGCGAYREVAWDGKTKGAWTEELEGADVLLNHAGRSVNCRYNAKNKAEIYASRLDSARIIGEAVRDCRNPPRLWMNSASATIYRHSEDRQMTEADGELGTGFSVDVCQKWERTFFDANTPGVRKVALRSAMVLGPGRGGVFHAFANLARLGLGGKMGSGRQYMSWIHYADFTEILEWIREHKELEGVLNLSAPYPRRNEEFMRTVRAACRMPVGLAASRWMLEVGALFLRTETELILKSRCVVPARLMESGYQFRYPHVARALCEIARA